MPTATNACNTNDVYTHVCLSGSSRDGWRRVHEQRFKPSTAAAAGGAGGKMVRVACSSLFSLPAFHSAPRAPRG